MEFIKENIVAIILGITTLITTLIALKYKRLEYTRKVEDYITSDRVTGLFLSREGMVKYFTDMYDHAVPGDIIWGQCVGCSNYPENVKSKILESASKGVKFKMILNEYSPSVNQLETIYNSLRDSDIVFSKDNAIRIQGLSTKEVIIAFPSVNSYTALLCKEKHFIEIIKKWFDERFEEKKQ